MLSMEAIGWEEQVTTFDERERAFENLFAHDEELRFKAIVRRNKAVAAWAATQMGKTGDIAAAYQADIITFGLDHAGDAALVERISNDLAAAGHAVPPAAIEAEMARGLAEAIAREKTA